MSAWFVVVDVCSGRGCCAGCWVRSRTQRRGAVDLLCSQAAVVGWRQLGFEVLCVQCVDRLLNHLHGQWPNCRLCYSTCSNQKRLARQILNNRHNKPPNTVLWHLRRPELLVAGPFNARYHQCRAGIVHHTRFCNNGGSSKHARVTHDNNFNAQLGEHIAALSIHINPPSHTRLTLNHTQANTTHASTTSTEGQRVHPLRRQTSQRHAACQWVR